MARNTTRAEAAEARDLVGTVGPDGLIPKVAAERKEFFTNQIVAINMQQADHDFKFAEFYQRTGHPGSAYFYFKIIERHYPGTQYAQKATERIKILDAQRPKTAPPPPSPDGPSRANPNAEIGPLPRSLAPGMPLLQGGPPSLLPGSITGPRQ